MAYCIIIRLSFNSKEKGALLAVLDFDCFACCFEVQRKCCPAAECVAVLETFDHLVRVRGGKRNVLGNSAERICVADRAVED